MVLEAGNPRHMMSIPGFLTTWQKGYQLCSHLSLPPWGCSFLRTCSASQELLHCRETHLIQWDKHQFLYKANLNPVTAQKDLPLKSLGTSLHWGQVREGPPSNKMGLICILHPIALRWCGQVCYYFPTLLRTALKSPALKRGGWRYRMRTILM